MSDFDDPELERILGRSGGPFPDVNLAYQQVQTRVRRAKRRRAAVMGGTACSLLLALGVLAAVRGGDGRSIQPGGSSELTGPDGSQLQPDHTAGESHVSSPNDNQNDSPNDTAGSTPSSTGDSSGDGTGPTPSITATRSSTGDASPASSNPAAGSPSNPPPTPATSIAPPPTATPTTVGTTTSTTASTTTSTTTSTTGTPPAPITQTFTGIGGSITVRNDGDTLTLVANAAAAGFTTEVRHSSGGHVEVRFESDAHRTDARVDLVNGTMTNNFTESPR